MRQYWRAKGRTFERVRWLHADRVADRHGAARPAGRREPGGVRQQRKRGKEAALKEDLFQMRKAIDEYYADKGKYPTDLQTLVTEKYLRSIAPDPFTGSAETWQQIPSELDPGNPSAEPGISDVKSGSDQTGG